MKNFVVIIGCLLLALATVSIFEYVHFHDRKLHVVFCDVGQGDAIFIITPDNKHILNDGGPDQKVLGCLARHLPFWERTIDLMLLTHPHADHFFGMFDVLQRYDVKSFATEELDNKTDSFQEFLKLLKEKNVSQHRVLTVDKWNVGGVQLEVVGPTDDYLHQTSPGGTIGESKEFASVITQVTYGNFSVLLTGDSQASGLESALSAITDNLIVLQSPHHGSKTGLNDKVLTALSPKVAAISVGVNKYGHPNPETLSLYKSHNIPFHRTDQEGDIEFVSDGKSWLVR
jgi:competence protein ComEC